MAGGPALVAGLLLGHGVLKPDVLPGALGHGAVPGDGLRRVVHPVAPVLHAALILGDVDHVVEDVLRVDMDAESLLILGVDAGNTGGAHVRAARLRLNPKDVSTALGREAGAEAARHARSADENLAVCLLDDVQVGDCRLFAQPGGNGLGGADAVARDAFVGNGGSGLCDAGGGNGGCAGSPGDEVAARHLSVHTSPCFSFSLPNGSKAPCS